MGVLYFPKIVAFDVILLPAALTFQSLAVIKGNGRFEIQKL